MPDQKAFLEQVNAHIGIIHKVINLYADDAGERSDLQQEVLYQAWRSYKNFRGEAKFSTWLYRLSLNTVLTHNRRKTKTTDLKHDREPTTDETYKDEAEQLWYEIKRLEEVDRALITLHLEGYGNGEVAEIMGVKANAVGVRLHRVKKHLQKRLQNG